MFRDVNTYLSRGAILKIEGVCPLSDGPDEGPKPVVCSNNYEEKNISSIPNSI